MTIGVLKSLLKEQTADLKSTISEQDKKLVNLEEKVITLSNKVDKLSTENEFLHKEINKINLVLCGVGDPGTQENPDQLYGVVHEILSKLNQQEITFDTVTRVGAFAPDKCRPVKIRFLSMTQRDLSFNNRKNLQKPLYLNEDLPTGTRKAQHILTEI